MTISRFLKWCAVGSLVGWVLGPIVNEVRAGVAHDTYHDWYKTLKQKSGVGKGYSCCNDQDCKPVAKWRYNRSEGYQFWVKGKWHTMPQDRIQFKVTPDGRAHLCSRTSRGGPDRRIPGPGLYVICAIVPKGLF